MLVHDTADLTVAAAGLHPAGTVEELARRVAQTTRDLVHADACGVLRFEEGGLSPFVATDDTAATADAYQVLSRSGPATALLDRFDSQRAPVSGAARLWPDWEEQIRGLGLLAAAAVPVHGGRGLLGVVTTYHREPSALTAQAEQALGRFAVHAGVAWECVQREEQLREGMAGRHAIGLAQGILMERYGLNTEQAFAVLRRYSQWGNIKLRTVAERLVETGQLPEDVNAMGAAVRAGVGTSAGTGLEDTAGSGRRR